MYAQIVRWYAVVRGWYTSVHLRVHLKTKISALNVRSQYQPDFIVFYFFSDFFYLRLVRPTGLRKSNYVNSVFSQLFSQHFLPIFIVLYVNKLHGYLHELRNSSLPELEKGV